jgi:peptide deformylase
MAVLPIVIGATTPVLRTKTKRIPKVTKEVLKLIADMHDTVKAAEGGGIAAPQIGVSLRVCLANINDKMTALINPEITWRSTETLREEEGCLSLPGVWKAVERSREIALTYMDEQGKVQERRFSDWNARVVQHEVDHLEGVLIVDYPALPNLASPDALAA